MFRWKKVENKKEKELLLEEIAILKEENHRFALKVENLEHKVVCLQMQIFNLSKKIREQIEKYPNDDREAKSYVKSPDRKKSQSFENSRIEEQSSPSQIDTGNSADTMREKLSAIPEQLMKTRSMTAFFPFNEKNYVMKKVDTHFKEIDSDTLQSFIQDVQNLSGHLLKELKEFLNQDSKHQALQIYQKIEEIEYKLIANPKIKTKWVDEQKYSLEELLETLIFNILYPKLFNTNEDESAKSLQLQERLTVLQNMITPEMLDVPTQFKMPAVNLHLQNERVAPLIISYFFKEIKKINDRKSPLNKLKVISCCFENLINLYQNNSRGEKPNADDLFPILVYVLINANPENLYSNLIYINKYVRQSYLIGEYGYLLTNTEAALIFLENLDGWALVEGKIFVKQRDHNEPLIK